MLQDWKIYRLRTRPCIFQPRNFTGCGSEGVTGGSASVSGVMNYVREQVLFVHVFYNNPAPVIRSMRHYCTVSNPGTGADDAFVLKRGM